MHYFDILTILCVGLMIGNEFAISVFVNPVVWQLEGHAQAKALSLFAGSLGVPTLRKGFQPKGS
jgi:hypothetical protein